MRRRHAGALAAALVFGACSDTTSPERPAVVLTPFELATLPVDQILGVGIQDLFADGVKPGYFFATGPAGNRVLQVVPAYSEGKTSSYATTDLWINVPKVWAQPLYILVTGFDEAGKPTPFSNSPTAPNWIMGVGPKSAFWSPYWQVFYAVIPATTPPGTYRTSRQLIEDGIRLVPGPPILATVVPATAGVTVEPTNPLLGDRTIGGVGIRTTWIDGEPTPVPTMNFGADRFRFNERLEIEEEPLVLVMVNDKARSGTWIDAGLPRIGGTGPLFSGRQALVGPGNRPAFGSFWRLYRLRLPENPDYGVLVPNVPAADPAEDPSSPMAMLRTKYDQKIAELEANPSTAWLLKRKDGALLRPPVDTKVVPTDPDGPAPLARYAFRVALNAATCFVPDAATGKAPLEKCEWLDSQAKLEKVFPNRLDPSEITVNCPFVSWNGAAVGGP